jgi:hypothetical protein
MDLGTYIIPRQPVRRVSSITMLDFDDPYDWRKEATGDTFSLKSTSDSLQALPIDERAEDEDRVSGSTAESPLIPRMRTNGLQLVDEEKTSVEPKRRVKDGSNCLLSVGVFPSSRRPKSRDGQGPAMNEKKRRDAVMKCPERKASNKLPSQSSPGGFGSSQKKSKKRDPTERQPHPKTPSSSSPLLRRSKKPDQSTSLGKADSPLQCPRRQPSSLTSTSSLSSHPSSKSMSDVISVGRKGDYPHLSPSCSQRRAWLSSSLNDINEAPPTLPERQQSVRPTA